MSQTRILCDKCGKGAAMHHISYPMERNKDQNLCCKCHVEQGESPSDWHPLCMETYHKMREDEQPCKIKSIPL